MAALGCDRSDDGAATTKRVRFNGTWRIEYDAAQAPVVRLGGAARHLTSPINSDTNNDALRTSLRLECAARGLTVANADDTVALQQALASAYAHELRSILETRGFLSASTNDTLASTNDSIDSVAALQQQLLLADLLLAQVHLHTGKHPDASAFISTLTLQLQLLQRLQLVAKDIDSFVDDGYVFGRRFVSIDAFIHTLEFDALSAIAVDRNIAVPDLSNDEKSAISVVERELCARHAPTALGKPLKQLTLRELTAEALARKLIVAPSKQRDESTGKRSKKGLLDKLRPVLRHEVRAAKILDQRDDRLRVVLLDVLEREAALHETQALAALTAQHVQRLERSHTASQQTAAMDVDDRSSNKEGHNDAADAMEDARTQLQCSFQQLIAILKDKREIDTHMSGMSMFSSLQRKQSMTQAATPPAATAMSPSTMQTSPSPSLLSAAHIKAVFSINPLVALASPSLQSSLQAPATPELSSSDQPATPPSSENRTASPADSSPSARTNSNDKSMRTKRSSLPTADGSNLRLPLPIEHASTINVETGGVASSSSAPQDADLAMRHSLGMIKSIRTQSQQLQQSESPRHRRAIGRDFTLPPSPMSSLLHENCSSLKDQFLKIKERFSAPSPVATKAAAASTPSTPLPVSAPAPAPSVETAAPTGGDGSTNTSSSSSGGAAAGSIDRKHDADAEEKQQSTASAPRDDLQPLADRHECVASTTSTLVGSDGTSMPDDATLVVAHDATWPLERAAMERWGVEGNYYRGSLTCWTMDRGAAIVSRIAAVVAAAAESEATTAPLSPTTAKKRINPDISLQWIGRQLYAITVSLPLSRTGELNDEHVALAARIDDVIARIDCDAATAGGDAIGDISSCISSPMRRRFEALDSDADNQALTVVLRDPDAALRPPPSSDSAFTAAAAIEANPRAHGSSDEDDSTAADATLSSLGSPAATLPVNYSNRALRSAVTAALENADEDDAAELDDIRPSESTSLRSVLESESDADVDATIVTSLPLSWSMLSTTSSLPESIHGGSVTSGGYGPGNTTDASALDDPHSPPEMTGWLKKKTGLNSWQQRYFELKGNRLYYFVSETDGVPRGAIVLDHAHVLRGKGEHCMSFSITTSKASQSLQIVKFSARMTPHVHTRKSCVLRVIHDSDESVTAWVTALNRASFYCNLSNVSGGGHGHGNRNSNSSSHASPGRKKKVPFYRLRATSSSSASASAADDEQQQQQQQQQHRHHSVSTGANGAAAMAATLEWASYHHYGSVKYLQDTDPLLWEIHPHDQVAIRKRAATARTRSDYVSILSKYSSTFRQIVLPRPRPISLEQTLRDILPELFLINNILYGGGDENNGLENIFEVLDSFIKRFASAQDERVRAVSSLLQACARTISGGDSYFVLHSLLGNPSMIIRPAEARGHPIEIDVSATTPSQFVITVFSAFSFHHIDDVEKYGDTCGTASDPSGSGGGTNCSSMTPEPLLRVKTYHIQEFDFASGKSSRWLQIRADGINMKDAPSAESAFRHTWPRRDGSDTGFGALLDALS